MKSVDFSGNGVPVDRIRESGGPTAVTSLTGVNCEKMAEPVANFIVAGCEKVISGDNDTWIVLGRDRPGHRSLGYGGKGHTKAGSIDIVVGRLGYEGKSVDEQGQRIFAEPDFQKDACRIYMSEKSDPDNYFSLAKGSSPDAIGVSSITLRADAVRIASRQGVKIVTGVGTHDSRGNVLTEIQGVDIIAGNDSQKLQPMVLGNNVLAALESLATQVEQLVNIVDSLLVNQMEMNQVVTEHTHFSPFFGKPTTVSPQVQTTGTQVALRLARQVKKGIITERRNLANMRLNFYNTAGASYVLSSYNYNN